MKRVQFYMDDDGCLVWKDQDGLTVRYTNEDLYMTDKYGNEMSMNEMSVSFKQNSPTYDELYEHWLKTKE